jgi:membrane-associated phospholipid phosphatase
VRTLVLVLALLGPVQQLDDDVRGAVQAARHAHRGWEAPMAFASSVGRPVVVAGGLLVVAIAEGTLVAGTARVALVAMAGANLIVESLKRLTFRARPDGEHRRSNAAFPSGHASTAAALAWALGRRWKRLAPLLWLFALWVAFSRMWLDRHWLTDVVVGMAIGMACGWAAWRWLPARARGERPGDTAAPADRRGARPGHRT